MKSTFRNAPSMSKASELGVPEIATLLVSAAFWSWMMLAMLRPTFFLPLGNFDVNAELFPAYRAMTVAVCTATLLVYALRGAMVKILDLKFWEWLFLGISALGGLCAIAGSALAGIPGYLIEAVAAVMVGVSAPYFLLEWCRMYMRRGALSCAPYISGALAVSFTLSLIIMFIDSMICAILVAFMPPLIGAALAGIRALSTYSSSSDSITQFNQEEAYGAAAVFTANVDGMQEPESEREAQFVQQPLTLLVSAVLAGIAFGCVQGLLLDAVSVAHLVLLFYVVGAALLFLCANKKPAWLRGAIAAYMALGIFSCLSPAPTNLGMLQPLPIQSIFIALGFMGYVVGMFVLCAYFAVQKSKRLVPAAAFNLFLFAIGAIFGFAAMEFLIHSEALSALGLQQRTVAGFMMIVAAALIAAASSTPLPLFESRKKAATSTGTDATTLMQGCKDAAAAIKCMYNLTAREEEVLVLLLVGRSRPRIAEILCLSENTVNSHIHHIYRKAGVANFQELLDIIYAEDRAP